MPPLLALLRPQQWVKNGFVAAPLFFTPAALSGGTISRVVAGIACFSAVASAIYILNDFRDRDGDRQHPEKRLRPLAAGTVAVSTALGTAALLAIGGLLAGLTLSTVFAGVLLLYFALNVGYSLGLKHVSILDVLIVAMGFVLRVEAGGALIGVTPSTWITVMTGLLALFLALAKRRDDLVKDVDPAHRRSLDGYNKTFLDQAVSVTLGALLVAYLVYTTDAQVQERLGTDRLYITAPFVVAGILRYLQITVVEERSGSPTRIALTDRFILITLAGWAVTFAALIYV